jgi:5,10-methylenetetrahydromethanopterin reductase
VTRHIVVIANAVATAANISGRGVRIVVGRGDSAVKFIGRAAQPVAAFEADLRILRDLLAGERVSLPNASYRLPEPPVRKADIYVAADGPRMWRLAGRLADGVLVGKSTFPGHLERAVSAVGEAAREAGRSPDAVPVIAWVHGSAAADRESAVDGLWPEVGRSVMHAVRSGRREVPEAVRAELIETALRQDKEFELSARLRGLLGDDILDDYTVVGTYEQCRDRLAGLLAVDGVAEVAVNPYPPGPGTGVGDMLRQVIA